LECVGSTSTNAKPFTSAGYQEAKRTHARRTQRASGIYQRGPSRPHSAKGDGGRV